MKTNKKLTIQFGQTDQIEGMIEGCLRKLDQLAPHPDRNKHLAPLFTRQADGTVISAVFNRETRYQMAWEAYNRDLPARLCLGRRLSALRRLLSALESCAARAACEPALA